MAPSGPVTSLIAFSSLACFGIVRVWDHGPHRSSGAADVNNRVEDAEACLQAFAYSISACPAAVEDHCPRDTTTLNYELPQGVFELWPSAAFVGICTVVICTQKCCRASPPESLVKRAQSKASDEDEIDVSVVDKLESHDESTDTMANEITCIADGLCPNERLSKTLLQTFLGKETEGGRRGRNFRHYDFLKDFLKESGDEVPAKQASREQVAPEGLPPPTTTFRGSPRCR